MADLADGANQIASEARRDLDDDATSTTPRPWCPSWRWRGSSTQQCTPHDRTCGCDAQPTNKFGYWFVLASNCDHGGVYIAFETFNQKARMGAQVHCDVSLRF